MQARNTILLTSLALLLGVLPLVAGHNDDSGDIGIQGTKVTALDPDSATAIAHRMKSYLRHRSYVGWHLAHVVLMGLAWVIAMPLAIMLSIARSRYHLPAQIFFHVLNGLGVFTAAVYNAATPDLYPDNSHHGLGWVVVGFTIAWTIMSLWVAYGEYNSKRNATLARGNLMQFHDETPSDRSSDSCQQPEDNSLSLFDSCQQSSGSSYQKLDLPVDDEGFPGDSDREPEKRAFLGSDRMDSFTKNFRQFSTRRTSKIIRFCQVILEKFLLLLGFAALTSGLVVSGGLFRDREVFNGLAHCIKGGIFVWYGMLTLGRWMGAFAEFGWAWNVRPQRPLVSKWKAMVPSAEFTESFVIWLYGASNIFLEHLSNWGGEWSASDLEHLSITFLFFGGGLLGMLVESKWARDLANTTIKDQKGNKDHTRSDPDQTWEDPKTYRVPLNPMPALTIMLLGMVMGGHHQQTMVSTMLHAQWGGLFSAFALARGVSYITLYLQPPTSHFPSRPPSEIVASFCLCAGGILFMSSAADTVRAIESAGLDAMTIFTASMGLTGILLAWEVVLFAIKGWAVRKESAVVGKPLASFRCVEDVPSIRP